VSGSFQSPQGVPGGGIPASMGGAPPGNLGGVTIPQSSPGNMKAAMEKLHAAAQLVNDAIPSIPLGDEKHTKVLRIATELNKLIVETKENVQGTVQTMLQAIQQMKQNQHPGMAGGAPGQPPPPPQPPAMPPAMAA
jgi:hypothetical protein